MPRVLLTRRQIVAFGAVHPVGGRRSCTSCCRSSPGSGTTVHRIEGGDTLVDRRRRRARDALVRRLRGRCSGPCSSDRPTGRIGWRESYEITMAGLVATRLFAAAGAGGVALTAWALRRSGMEPRLVACRMVAFMVLLYVVYAALAADRRHRARHGAVPGGRLVRDHDRPGDRRGGACSARRARWRCCRATSSGACSGGRRARAAAARFMARAVDRAGARRERCAHRDRARARTRVGPARARSPGGASTSSVLWAMFHAFGDAAAVHGDLDGVLRRHARQPAAAAGRPRRRRGRHDRCASRRSAWTSTWRSLAVLVLPRHLVLAADAPGRGRLLPAAAHGGALARGASSPGRCDARRRWRSRRGDLCRARRVMLHFTK